MISSLLDQARESRLPRDYICAFRMPGGSPLAGIYRLTLVFLAAVLIPANGRAQAQERNENRAAQAVAGQSISGQADVAAKKRNAVTPIDHRGLDYDLTAVTLDALRQRGCALIAYGNVTGASISYLRLVARAANSRRPSTPTVLTPLDAIQPSPERTGTVSLCHTQIKRATRGNRLLGNIDVLEVALFDIPHRDKTDLHQHPMRDPHRRSPWLRIPCHLWCGN